MTTYRPFKKHDVVKLIKRTEIKPSFFINNDVQGVVIDTTTPDYYLVRFTGYGAYWVEGCKLEKFILNLI